MAGFHSCNEIYIYFGLHKIYSNIRTKKSVVSQRRSEYTVAMAIGAVIDKWHSKKLCKAKRIYLSCMLQKRICCICLVNPECWNLSPSWLSTSYLNIMSRIIKKSTIQPKICLQSIAKIRWSCLWPYEIRGWHMKLWIVTMELNNLSVGQPISWCNNTTPVRLS